MEISQTNWTRRIFCILYFQSMQNNILRQQKKNEFHIMPYKNVPLILYYHWKNELYTDKLVAIYMKLETNEPQNSLFE